MAEAAKGRDQVSAETFVKETLAAMNASTVDRSVIALSFLEVAGALIRQDLIEQPSRLGLYARSVQVFADHVLDSVHNPREVWQ